MSIWRLRSLIRKEFLHIVRDPRTLFVMFIMPIVQLVLLGYAATTDVENLSTGVLDRDKSCCSHALPEAAGATDGGREQVSERTSERVHDGSNGY